MKITMKTKYRSTIGLLEEGNTHDTEVLGLPDEEAVAMHAAGMCEIEGHEPAPDMDPQKTHRLAVQNSKIGNKASTPGAA